MKSRIIATLIVLFVILVPFRIAFINASLDSQLLNAGMMILTILLSMAAVVIGSYQLFDKGGSQSSTH